MGLDLVELVLRLEEEFEIKIPDEVASELTTPGKTIDWIAKHPEVSRQWSRDYVEVTVWLAVEDELGIKKEDYNNDSRYTYDMGAG